jgi:DNA-binding response OmpR family regulator
VVLATTPVRLPVSPLPAAEVKQGLLITHDPGFARAFRRELERAGHAVPIELYPSLAEAASRAATSYAWVTIDLDGGVPPADAVRVARWSWPNAVLALVRYWWSDGAPFAEASADHIIHKPVRAAELHALVIRAAAQPALPPSLVRRTQSR